MKKLLLALSLVAVTCLAVPTNEPPTCPFDVKTIDIDTKDPKYRHQLYPVKNYPGWFIQTDDLGTILPVYRMTDETGEWEHRPFSSQTAAAPEFQPRSLGGCHHRTTVWVRPSHGVADAIVTTAAVCCCLSLFCR